MFDILTSSVKCDQRSEAEKALVFGMAEHLRVEIIFRRRMSVNKFAETTGFSKYYADALLTGPDSLWTLELCLKVADSLDLYFEPFLKDKNDDQL